MDYDAVVKALYERHRSVRDAGFKGDAYKPGLEAMASYADFLGHPERRFRCIHVAGTNGKGSVCSMLAAALAAEGFRVGLYTSPHLIDFRERMKIVRRSGGRLHSTMISRSAVCRFMECFDKDGLSFFEITTGMAFSWFAEKEVDIAVIETGLGGRLDSTNIITPDLSVISSIGLDHCDLLGNTRDEIAFEKAGIFKPGVPALVWGRDPETSPVFERVAASAGSDLFYAEDYPVPGSFPVSEMDLGGACIELNLRTVLAALCLLHIPADKKAVTFKAITRAAAITGLRGRWEILRRNPLIICDIGHNPPALKANFEKLAAIRAGRPLLIVYGVMADKAIDDIKPLLPPDAEYYFVEPETPRALPLEALALKLNTFHGVSAGKVTQGIKQALARASVLQDPIIYIGGSTFVVSEAITFIDTI